ncbi:MAG: MarR family winged helix-turn-helix transcriptional regulator [Stellaceae bacterium]
MKGLVCLKIASQYDIFENTARTAFCMADHVPTQHDYEMLAEFRSTLSRFLAFSEAAARRAGLMPRQHQALLAIKGFTGPEPIATGQLAERLGVRHHSAVGLVDRLVAKELIRRQTGPDDHRQVLLELTPKAQDLLAKLSMAHRDELKQMAPLLRVLLNHFERGSSRDPAA